MKLERMPAWDPKQVKEKDDVKAESDLKGLPVHVAELMAPTCPERDCAQ